MSGTWKRAVKRRHPDHHGSPQYTAGMTWRWYAVLMPIDVVTLTVVRLPTCSAGDAGAMLKRHTASWAEMVSPSC